MVGSWSKVLLLAVLWTVCSPSAWASGFITEQQTACLTGGACAKCAYVEAECESYNCYLDSMCGAGQSYCDVSKSVKHSLCKDGELDDTCTKKILANGCGDMRENGSCTFWPEFRCTGGRKIGACMRSRALGSPCK